MAKQCEIFGTKSKKAASRSHSNIKTLRRQKANLHKKIINVPELGKKITVRLSTKGVRTITKYGTFSEALLRTTTATLSPQLKKVKKKIQAVRSKKTA